MSIARQVTTALKGRWYSNYGLASCPSHPDGRTPALKIRDDPGKSHGLDVHCFSGCPWQTVKDDLARHGILEEWRPKLRQAYPSLKFTDEKPQDNDHYEAAKEIWQATEPIKGTLAATYLEMRGLHPPWPAWLRYHGALKHGPSNLVFPALVSGIVDGTGDFTAVHRTYLKIDGSGKADVNTPKMALGALRDGAVRLGQAGKTLGLAEGTETGLSAQQIFDISIWCALGSRLDRVSIPAGVIEVQIFADNGEPGREAAAKAREAFTAAGKRVAIRRAPEGFGDWNDALPYWQGRPAGDWEF